MIRFSLCLIILLSALLGATADATPLKVGVIVPLSGPLAIYGVATRQGIELAVSENPDAFKDIEFLYEDSQYDGKASISAFRKLVNGDRADIVYVWGTLPTEVIAPLAKLARIPTILLTSDGSIHRNNPWVIRTQTTFAQFGTKLSNYLHERGVKKLAIFKVDIVYYTAMYEGLKDALHSDQSIVALNSFTPDQMDFRSSVSKLKGLGVDAVGVYLIPGQIAQLYRQLSEQSEMHATFGTEDLGTKSEIEKFPRLMEGAVFARNPVVTSFAESYGKRYGNDIHIGHAAHAYDMAVFLTLMPKSGTPEQFMQTFRTAPVQSGPLGMPERSSVPQGGVSFTSPVALGMIKNGAVVATR